MSSRRIFGRFWPISARKILSVFTNMLAVFQSDIVSKSTEPARSAYAVRAPSVFVLLVARTAFACGPDFPLEFLYARDKTIASLPDGLFMLEAARLVPDDVRFVLVNGEPKGVRNGGGDKERAFYAAGAKLWHAGKTEAAREKFLALLALPVEERRRFTLPAEYNLAESEPAAAASRHFETIRTQAAAGAEDVFGLALTSFGEQAKLALSAGDDARAAHLYALQAKGGDSSGATSLLFMAREIAADDQRLARDLTDPGIQRLLATFSWTRSQEDWWTASHTTAAKLLEKLLAVPRVAGGDRLAAALFRAGRFEEAERLAVNETSAIAHWVKAKLAERKGDGDTAERELAAASASYPLSERWTNQYQVNFYPRQQLEMERAILALQREAFTTAMEHALASCSWQDVAYLAERVIDLPTLQKIVDTPRENECAAVASRRDEDEVDSSLGWVPHDQRATLRSVLARRLLRVGRGVEALPYFDDATRRFAQDYVAALAASKKGDSLARASALYRASRVARAHGMALLGYEVDPDFAWTQGYYDPRYEVKPAPVSVQEQQRCQANAPQFDVRYHYRQVSSHLAEDAAALVSPHTQAFTALLCHAAHDVVDRDDERVGTLYERSVKEGPLLREPMIFARQCPEPHFVAPPHEPWHLRKRWLALAALALVGVFFVWRARVSRSRPRPPEDR